MSMQKDFSSAAIYTVGQYHDAGKTLLNAYCAGVRRLLGGAYSRYDSFIGQGQLPWIKEEARTTLLGASNKISGFLADRLDIGAARAGALMDSMAEGATKGIDSMAQAAARTDLPFYAQAREAFERVQEPFSSMSVKIAETVAAGAKRIENRVAGINAEAGEQEIEAVESKPARRRRAAAESQD